MAIAAGHVTVNGLPATRAATMVATDSPIDITQPVSRFVSRGGDKLDGALQRLDCRVAGRRWLDAGASTGGFTDRLLQGGATAVIAIDVGYGQLDWRLRNDRRVHVLERTNVRNVEPGDLPWAPDGVVADLSFISLVTVMPALVRVAAGDADFVLLVKPQFEVGRENAGRGVVREPRLWRAAVENVVRAGAEVGLGLAGATCSDVAGPKGNREFFVHLRRGATAPPSVVARAIESAS